MIKEKTLSDSYTTCPQIVTKHVAQLKLKQRLLTIESVSVTTAWEINRLCGFNL